MPGRWSASQPKGLAPAQLSKFRSWPGPGYLGQALLGGWPAWVVLVVPGLHPSSEPPRVESRSLRWHLAHLLEKVKELPLNRDAVGDPPQLLSFGETSCIFLVCLYQTCKRKYCFYIYFLLEKSNIEKRSDSQGISLPVVSHF